MSAQLANLVTYAEVLDRAAQTTLEAFRGSILGHQEALEELAEVWKECQHPGWDGHEALPVEAETLRGAYTLIESLPLGFPRPSISAEPDGQLTLEWYKSPSRTLSVSVDPDGFLHYAGLFGASKRYGTLAYFSSAPAELIQLVRGL
jgi:hypothetical protein